MVIDLNKLHDCKIQPSRSVWVLPIKVIEYCHERIELCWRRGI